MRRIQLVLAALAIVVTAVVAFSGQAMAEHLDSDYSPYDYYGDNDRYYGEEYDDEYEEALEEAYDDLWDAYNDYYDSGYYDEEDEEALEEAEEAFEEAADDYYDYEDDYYYR